MSLVRGSVVLTLFIALPALARADAFDNYINPILVKAAKSKAVKRVQKLSSADMIEHSRDVTGLTAAFVIVKTNDGRMARLLVRPGAQKTPDGTVPVTLLERFVTYREGDEKTVQAAGQDVRLFGDFHFSLDLGQVVPAKLGGDLKFVADGKDTYLEPVGKAEMYLLTEAIPEAAAKKATRPQVGEKFEPRYFNGVYKLYDDGRRSGSLHLKVDDMGDVQGWYYSDKDGQKYEVDGKVGNPLHLIQFTITFPRSMQTFRGFMFTGDGRAIAGTSRLQERETAFYAVREGEEK